MAKVTKKSVKPNSGTPKTRTLVLYVENSSPSIKLFSSKKSATTFINAFKKRYTNPDDGYWVDLLITDITGEITSLDGYYEKSL